MNTLTEIMLIMHSGSFEVETIEVDLYRLFLRYSKELSEREENCRKRERQVEYRYREALKLLRDLRKNPSLDVIPADIPREVRVKLAHEIEQIEAYRESQI